MSQVIKKDKKKQVKKEKTNEKEEKFEESVKNTSKENVKLYVNENIICGCHINVSLICIVLNIIIFKCRFSFCFFFMIFSIYLLTFYRVG